MRYVRCLNNKSYVHFRGQPLRDETLASLTIGRVYKALPPTEDERRLGELRIIDNEGEDYLYPIRIKLTPSRQKRAGVDTKLAAFCACSGVRLLPDRFESCEILWSSVLRNPGRWLT